MIPTFARTDHSIFGRWWWTVDHWTLLALAMIIGMGAWLVAAASPAVAERIHLGSYFFVWHHLVMLIPTLVLMIGISLMSPRQIRRFAMIALIFILIGLVLTPIIGTEIKGARRWISIFGQSIQCSEFLKPVFAVTIAWAFSRKHAGSGYAGHLIAICLYGLVALLLLLQPDFGQTFVITMIFFGEFFLAGLPIVFVVASVVLVVCGLVGAYFVFPHVQSRIDRFLNPAAGDTYQIDQSINAFTHGGVFGVGPGQGQVKFNLPDAHADFIFAVAGEELGLICTVLIVCLFGFVVLRGFTRVSKESDLFVMLGASGLLIQFGLQAIIHMGSSLHLLPAKGMTLPFISYGGSSLLALGIGTGMMLALTRRRFGPLESADVFHPVPR
jgi:cell division protein FtsW